MDLDLFVTFTFKTKIYVCTTPFLFLGEIQDGGTRYQAADQREGRLEESPKTWHRTPRRPCPLKSSQK